MSDDLFGSARGLMGCRSDSGTNVATDSWVSAYFTFSGALYGADCDTIIRDVVRPLVQHCRVADWISRAFFIRYSEAGPHVRVRMQPRSDTAWRYVINAIEAASLTGHAASALETRTTTGLRWVEYQPELDRYGGVQAMRAAETLFDASTTLAFSILTPEVSADRSMRTGRAMLATLTTLYVLLQARESVLEFSGRYTHNYLRTFTREQGKIDEALQLFGRSHERQAASMRQYVEYTWEQLEAGTSLSPALDAYREGLIAYRREVEAIFRDGKLSSLGGPYSSLDVALRSLCASMVHMTNNRLGISTPEESYVAFVLSHALDARYRR